MVMPLPCTPQIIWQDFYGSGSSIASTLKYQKDCKGTLLKRLDTVRCGKYIISHTVENFQMTNPCVNLKHFWGFSLVNPKEVSTPPHCLPHTFGLMRQLNYASKITIHKTPLSPIYIFVRVCVGMCVYVSVIVWKHVILIWETSSSNPSDFSFRKRFVIKCNLSSPRVQ